MSNPVDVGRSDATGWPTINDLSVYTGVPETDPALQWALDGSVDYGLIVLGDRFVGPVSDTIFRACLDYAGSIYTERIGQADVAAEAYYGSTPLNRYRRVLMANRFTAIA